MDIKKYIESGVLESYALGIATEAERYDVEQMAMKYPEIGAELEAIEIALGSYAQAETVDLPKGLGDSALAKIDELNSPTLPALAGEKSSFSSLGILFGLLSVAFAAGCFYFYNQSGELQANLNNTQAQLDSLQQDCADKDTYIQFLTTELGILKDTSTQTVYMKGVEAKDPNAIAAVHHNSRTQKTYLDIRSLPEPPSDKQYQLWAIVDGAPVDMGVFDLSSTDNSSFIEVPFIANPQAFAVTLEDFGGKPTPNLQELYVIGNV